MTHTVQTLKEESMLLGGSVVVFGQVVECSQKLGGGWGW